MRMIKLHKVSYVFYLKWSGIWSDKNNSSYLIWNSLQISCEHPHSSEQHQEILSRSSVVGFCVWLILQIFSSLNPFLLWVMVFYAAAALYQQNFLSKHGCSPVLLGWPILSYQSYSLSEGETSSFSVNRAWGIKYCLRRKLGVDLDQHTSLTNTVSGRSFGEVYIEPAWKDWLPGE